MAKQTKARLDTKGLTGLGLEKLVEILLEESAVNKPLKARLLSALASTSGPGEVARLIDKRLDTLQQSRSRVSASKARELAVELLGLARNIVSDLGAADAVAAMERLLRLLSVYDGLADRLYENSVKLGKSFDDAASMAADLASRLSEAQQLQTVPLLEAARRKDKTYRISDIFADVLCTLGPAAADAWKAMILPDASASKAPSGKAASAIAILQQLAERRNDVENFVALEELKPANRRDNLGIARKLHAGGRSREALQWLLDTPKGMRVVEINGMIAGVGAEYQAKERRLLEADIRDALKERDKAQDIRWKEFLKGYDVDILRQYISKLPDFAEFEELDKAFAAVRSGENIYAALHFLIAWPKLDLASEHVLKNAGKWNGVNFDWLGNAADLLAQDYPVAATVLYRSMIDGILAGGMSEDYLDAAGFYAALVDIAPRLPEYVPFEKHAAYLARLRQKHGRKYIFWNMVPAELQI